MAIVVEDGTVVASADSYVSVAFADAYFAFDIVFADTWSALSTTVKENKLKWATRTLDQKVRWNGDKTTETSSLRWPRTGLVDRDDVTIDDNSMPLQLKQLTCEMAKFMHTTDATTSQGADALKSVVVDVVELHYQDGASQPSTPPLFNQLLRNIGFYPMASGNVFGKIVKV